MENEIAEEMLTKDIEVMLSGGIRYWIPKELQNSVEMAKLITEYTGFKVTSAEAARILETEENVHHHCDHKYLCEKTFPKVDDFEEFYVYGSEIRNDLIGRVLSKYQCTVWGTGTHTATPVTVTAMGNPTQTDAVNGVKTHAEVGNLLKKWVSEK